MEFHSLCLYDLYVFWSFIKTLTTLLIIIPNVQYNNAKISAISSKELGLLFTVSNSYRCLWLKFPLTCLVLIYCCPWKLLKLSMSLAVLPAVIFYHHIEACWWCGEERKCSTVLCSFIGLNGSMSLTATFTSTSQLFSPFRWNRKAREDWSRYFPFPKLVRLW